MFASRTTLRTLRPIARSIPKQFPIPITRSFASTPLYLGKDPKMSSEPPKHEMVYFPGLTSNRREFGQFRKVMHTGLYSQIVSMEIPVGGDIGDEVHMVGT